MRLVGVPEGWVRANAGIRGRGVAASSGVPGDQPRGTVLVLHSQPSGFGLRRAAGSRGERAHSENINFFGAIEVDIDAELAQLGPTGYRPLRVRDTLF